MNKGLSFLHSLRGAASSLLLASLLFGTVAAQTSMPVPYGSFEQWSSHPGYSVTAGFIPVSVYSSFSTPTGWDYLSYPVNQSISLGITTVTVDTQLPLIKASQESGSVPAGNSAVKLQSFKLSDIISSAVYAVAAGSIDPELTSEVFPSILTTGTVDIDRFIPMMGSLISNMGNTGALLSSLADIDVNYLVSGGIALGSFEPTYLSGSYKYHSAVGGDNGGVVILGTRYNPLLHRREVVGGGANIALTDHSSYTAFTVDYHSLHDYDASFAEQAPDSLIVMLISSASQNRQQGSWMCVDNLNLWHVDPPEPPDTTTVGIYGPAAGVTATDVVVYPNPAHGQCTVKCAADGALLKLYSSDGRLMLSEKVEGDRATLALPGSGVFLLQVVTREGSAVRKIVGN